nr:MAG TPA: hypothetical protein [Caudoviricetes sp.]
MRELFSMVNQNDINANIYTEFYQKYFLCIRYFAA